MSVVTLCQTKDRSLGVRSGLEASGLNGKSNPAKGKDVLLKANYNTADPSPSSTHNTTLSTLIDLLWEMGAVSITLGERSLRATRQVLEEKGLLKLLEEKGVRAIVFDDLPEKDWVEIKRPGHHWKNGFRIARPVLETDCLVETCCLKTHGHGGVFSLSLKLAVGFLPGLEQMPRYMKELHGSPHQRRMIAEINTVFQPSIIILDGVDAFVEGGPITGRRADGGVMLAGTDPVAVDAAGVSCLKRLGSIPAIMKKSVFSQEQISRASELGLGAEGPDEVVIQPADRQSAGYAQEIQSIIRRRHEPGISGLFHWMWP